jgi:hypothetical protein
LSIEVWISHETASTYQKEVEMKSRILVTVGLAVLLVLPTAGQTPTRPIDPKAKEAFKELFTEVRNFAQENIIPKMKEWKAKLDNAMTPEDREALDVLRSKAARLKAAARKLTADVRAARLLKDRGKLRELKVRATRLKRARNEMLKDLKPIALKYKETLLEIGKESKPLGREWRAESKKMVKEWYETHKSELGPGAKRLLARAVQRLKRLSGLDEELKAKIATARFMLWDGKDLPEVGTMQEGEEGSEGSSGYLAPEGYSLEPNYPNPFNPSTKISFTIARPEHVLLTVYDALGREVGRLVDADLGAGTHSATFDARNLASGVYIYRLQAGEFSADKKMQLVK